jgi:uncharacterized protein YjbJ (UPF0337 family)
MNWDRIEGQWRQLKGKAQQRWGKLTDDDWDLIAGQREELVGRVQELREAEGSGRARRRGMDARSQLMP